MKVLIVSVWKPRRGGIVTHVGKLLENTDFEHLILTYEDPGTSDEQKVMRVRYVNLPVIRGFSFAINAYLKARNEEFDIIHSHYSIPQGLAGALIKKAAKKPLVLTVHGSDVTGLGSTPIFRPILRWVLRSSDIIIAVSEHLKERLIDLGAAPEKIKVIHNGVDPAKRSKGSAKRIVFVGALVKQKGVDLLLNACKLLEEDKREVELYIVGDGPERKNLERLASKLGLKNVTFTGYVDDLDTVFTTESTLVLPSREEGFGITILEAMARGIPVIASNTGGIPEIISEGVNGLLFEREDVGQLYRSIVTLLEDESFRKKLIDEGLKTVKKFSWEKMVDEVGTVYEELL